MVAGTEWIERLYGHPRLTLLRRRSQGGVPEIEEIACEARDVWADEWAAFVEAIAPSGASECSAESANATDGLEALRVVQRIYKGEEESGAHRVLPDWATFVTRQRSNWQLS